MDINRTILSPIHGMSARELIELIKTKKQTEQDIMQKGSNQLLIVDCRSTTEYLRQPARFAENLPTIHIDATSCQEHVEFHTKISVIEFLNGHCADVLHCMHTPGYYKKIVIIDNVSTTQSVSVTLNNIRLALTKWNECTKTSIKVAEGGIKGLISQVRTDGDEYFAVEALQPFRHSFVNQNAECSYKIQPEEQTVLDGFKKLLANLDQAIEISKVLLNFRAGFKSLEIIKEVLNKERSVILTKQLEDQIPDVVKCSVCLEVYGNRIFQCSNGHCICETCYQPIQVCAECRAPLSKTQPIRTRALEELLNSVLHATCACGEEVRFADVQRHASSCSNGAEMLAIYKEIENGKNYILSEVQRLGVLLAGKKKDIMAADTIWMEKLSLFENTKALNSNARIFYGWHEKQTKLTELTVKLAVSALIGDQV